MRISVIIPVWYGEDVIVDCLTAVYQHATPTLHELICVDNGSPDGSAVLIAAQFPQVRLLTQPVNLGFAGGVNAGIQAAQGDVFLLLNQDCLVHENWLAALSDAFAQGENIGIVGGTIYDADGAVNHAGAVIQRPSGYGLHLTAVPNNDQPQPAEYVTGAIFAIRRTAWEATGPFDEDFYPAYFEESDYCYRARRKGYETVYAPAVKGTHLFTSREWQQDPLKHTANQHHARYRFIAKHFASADLPAFFQSEAAAIGAETYLDQTLGRFLGARDMLRDLPGIIAARERDGDERITAVHTRQLNVGFGELSRLAWTKAQAPIPLHHLEIGDVLANYKRDLQAFKEQEQAIIEQEQAIIAQSDFRNPEQQQPETKQRPLWQQWVLRPYHLLTLRDYRLQTSRNTARLDLQATRLDLQATRLDLQATRLDLQATRLDLLIEIQRITEEMLKIHEAHINRHLEHLSLLETLTNYEYH